MSFDNSNLFDTSKYSTKNEATGRDVSLLRNFSYKVTVTRFDKRGFQTHAYVTVSSNNVLDEDTIQETALGFTAGRDYNNATGEVVDIEITDAFKKSGL